MSDITTTPSVVAATVSSVTLAFINQAGQQLAIEFPLTAIKGQAQWAARRLAERGATVPDYGSKERKEWASGLRSAVQSLRQSRTESEATTV